jgi:hypothetical protein
LDDGSDVRRQSGRRNTGVSDMSLNTREPAAEQKEAPHPRKGQLRRELSSFAVLLLTLSSLSPVVSVFGIGGDVLHQAGAAAASLFGLAILVALVWSVVYAELGSAYPYAGGDYVGVGHVLGGWAGMVTVALWALSAGPAVAFAAETLAPYVAQFAPQLPPPLVIFGGLAGALGVALLSVRRGARNQAVSGCGDRLAGSPNGGRLGTAGAGFRRDPGPSRGVERQRRLGAGNS